MYQNIKISSVALLYAISLNSFCVFCDSPKNISILNNGVLHDNKTCCTVLKGNSNGGCLLHYAHVLYDFVIPFYDELRDNAILLNCKRIYYPSFPLVVKWMSSLFGHLPLIPYSARGSCIGDDRKLPHKFIRLTSINLIKPLSSNVFVDFKEFALSRIANTTCISNILENPSQKKMLIIDRSDIHAANFTSLCKRYNRNLRRWFGPNMPIICRCDYGDSRGNLAMPSVLLEQFRNQKSLLSPQLNIELVHLDQLSIEETISKFCQSSIILGYHGAGLLNILFSPKNSLLLEVPRNANSSHSNMMPALAKAARIHHRTIDISDLNKSQSVNYRFPALNVTQIILGKISEFEWQCKFFINSCRSAHFDH